MVREGINYRDMGFKDGQDITHVFDVSSSFEELFRELKLQSKYPDVNVTVHDKKYNLGELTEIFSTLNTYADENKAQLQIDPELLDRYLAGPFPGAQTISNNPTLLETAKRLVQNRTI